MSVTRHPPRRSPRAELPHEAPILDGWRQSEPRGKDEERADWGATASPVGSFAPSSGSSSGHVGVKPAATAESPECGISRGYRCCRYRVVVEVALYDRFEPLAGCAPLVRACADGAAFNLCQLRAQALTNCVALYDIVPVPVLRTDVREAQEIERLRLPLSSSSPGWFGESPELDPARLVWV